MCAGLPLPEGEAWSWPEESWRKVIGAVRAGDSLNPTHWPNAADVAVAISFDPDHDTIPLRDRDGSISRLSQGQYGTRRGLPRVFTALETYGVPASFFIPAVSALLYPDDVRRMVDGGHEVALHGWIHERNTLLDADDERDLLLRSAAVLEQLTGTWPRGMRTPSWDFSSATLAIAEEMGLLYDSSLMADDDPYVIVSDGRITDVVEIPVEWIRDDAVYFPMERFVNLRPLMAPSAVLEIWTKDFDRALAERGVFQLTMHPHVIGHRSRIWVLESLLAHIKSCGAGVWFATHEELAQYVLNPGDDPAA